MQNTLVICKPDCVRRGLVGVCLSRFERRGLAIADLRVVVSASMKLLEAHYAEHRGREYYNGLVLGMRGGPVVACVLAGDVFTWDGQPDLVATVRRLVGPYKAAPAGTIRGDYMTATDENLVHASDSDEAAGREVALWFPAVPGTMPV